MDAHHGRSVALVTAVLGIAVLAWAAYAMKDRILERLQSVEAVGVGNLPDAIAAGDFDSDGRIDLILIPGPRTLYTYTPDGKLLVPDDSRGRRP